MMSQRPLFLIWVGLFKTLMILGMKEHHKKEFQQETSVKGGDYFFNPEDGGDMFIRNVG
jgi:hypothetical protein